MGCAIAPFNQHQVNSAADILGAVGVVLLLPTNEFLVIYLLFCSLCFLKECSLKFMPLIKCTLILVFSQFQDLLIAVADLSGQ